MFVSLLFIASIEFITGYALESQLFEIDADSLLATLAPRGTLRNSENIEKGNFFFSMRNQSSYIMIILGIIHSCNNVTPRARSPQLTTARSAPWAPSFHSMSCYVLSATNQTLLYAALRFSAVVIIYCIPFIIVCLYLFVCIFCMFYATAFTSTLR